MAGRQIQGRGGRRHRLLTPHDLAGIISGQSNGTTGGVSSVNGKTGSVILAPSDIGAAPDSALQSIVAGANISVDNTDPRNPKISAGIAPPANYDAVVLADAPAAYWKLNETSGTTMVDSSGNSRNGTYIGGYTLGQSMSRLSGAVLFNGTSGYATVPYGAWMSFASAWTLECWATPLASQQTVIARAYPGSGSIEYAMSIAANANANPPSGFFVGKYDGTVNAWRLAGITSNGATFVPYHMVGTYDGSLITLYINGYKIATLPSSGFNVATTDLYIARRWDLSFSPYFSGLISSCALYPTALSGSRVIAHYNAGK